MAISLQEKIQRQKNVDFVRNNSRLEGFVNNIPEIDQLYQDYVNGTIDLEQLVDKTRLIMDDRLPLVAVAN